MSTHSGNSRESSPEREEHQKTKDDDTPRQDAPAKDSASGHLVPNVIVSSPNGGSSKKSSRDPSPVNSVKSNTSEKAKITDPKKRVTRSTANTIPADYLCRIRSQADRLTSIKELADSMNSQEDPGMAMYEYWSKHIDQLFDEFKAEHNKLESSCPAALLDHEYFTQGTLCLAERGYQHISLKLAVLKEKLVLNGKFIDKHGSCSSSAHPSSTRPKLPEIKLINFSGSYADWPAYKEMTTSFRRLSRSSMGHAVQALREQAIHHPIILRHAQQHSPSSTQKRCLSQHAHVQLCKSSPGTAHPD
ncbi:unnamed protein product [Trichogramma brassicae]|uniref:Uncharacterized protein n=1 Tax=Trichogramma brassicae TaxID=86971 RepID=A0A6H5IUH5_9HYME|nr:unnamed protein product [Trichogramma brassicae]